MIRVTLGLVLSMRTATVRPVPPTPRVCENAGTKRELTNNNGLAWALVFVRSQLFARAVRFTVSFVFVLRLENFFVLLSSRVTVDADNRVSELKNELKSRVLLFFRVGYHLPGDT